MADKLPPSVKAMIDEENAPTGPLDEFADAYANNDNLWWYLACGHHQNLFEEAIDRLGAVSRLHQPDPEGDIKGLGICMTCGMSKPWPCPTRRALDGEEGL